jgi:hypothetical protein
MSFNEQAKTVKVKAVVWVEVDILAFAEEYEIVAEGVHDTLAKSVSRHAKEYFQHDEQLRYWVEVSGAGALGIARWAE